MLNGVFINEILVCIKDRLIETANIHNLTKFLFILKISACLINFFMFVCLIFL